MSPKLSRKQLANIRKQAKESREQNLEKLKLENEKEYEQEKEKASIKRDKLGFTQEERAKIYAKKSELSDEKPKTRVSWNFQEGELVYLPNGDIGIIVKNNARDMEVNYHYVDNKDAINRYAGQVFVVTSSGNNWYYPKTLKPVR